MGMWAYKIKDRELKNQMMITARTNQSSESRLFQKI